jgi:hypothetical protein
MPLQSTSGAASYDAFGGGAAAEPNYIESCFSTYLYTGNGSTQTITNGIDLAGEGGLVWGKNRSSAVQHALFDTVRGQSKRLATNLTSAEVEMTPADGVIKSFNSNGFTLDVSAGTVLNASGVVYASWTFRKQPKFFDIVTWTGNGISPRIITHNLGSAPGCVIGKRTSTTSDWTVYHRSLNGGTNPDQYQVLLNTTAAQSGPGAFLLAAAPTSTSISLSLGFNSIGVTYVAYLFAHDAGGFGLTGTDNVISCGSYTGGGSPTTVTLGWEPQFLIVKKASGADQWVMADVMRGIPTGAADPIIYAESSAAENSGGGDFLNVSPTGFYTSSANGAVNGAGETYIYIAIRRGPMKVPTTGTSVFGLSARTGTGSNATVTGSAGVTDLAIIKNRGSTPVWAWASRLTGRGYLSSNATTAETTAGSTILQDNPWDVMDGIKVGTTSTITNASSNTFINYLIDRAPGFMDLVCYTGTGAGMTVTHNLGVIPELIIVKSRSTATVWPVRHVAFFGTNDTLQLNGTSQKSGSGLFGSGTPTSTTFTLGNDSTTTGSGVTYIAYLFASCPNVSKVGSYTGNGSSQTINCGFTGGARFVLIKRTNSTGDWYVWDSSRGIVAGNDPHLSFNSTAAEVTTNDSVDTDSTGFVVNQVAATNVNVNTATYIFLAIA